MKNNRNEITCEHCLEIDTEIKKGKCSMCRKRTGNLRKWKNNYDVHLDYICDDCKESESEFFTYIKDA